MPFPVAIRNGWLSSITPTHLAAFDADTAAGGTEVSSARIAATFAAASAGARALQGTPLELDIPAGAQVTHLGAYSASTGGTLQATHALPATDVFGSAGKLRILSWNLTVS